MFYFSSQYMAKEKEKKEFGVKKEGSREQDGWITPLKMGEFDAVCKIRLLIADAYERDGCWREQCNRKTIKSGKCKN